MAAVVPSELLRFGRRGEERRRLRRKNGAIVPAVHHEQRSAVKRAHGTNRIGDATHDRLKWRLHRQISARGERYSLHDRLIRGDGERDVCAKRIARDPDARCIDRGMIREIANRLL